MSKSDYDETPYPSFCYPRTAPSRLATIGTLFGMTPPPPPTARILEIGSALGGNLIPLAARYPQARCVGIDYSENQVAVARRDAEALNLTNITFLSDSILDLDERLGSFDYIIAHGFYSWVDDTVRDKAMALTKACLSQQGIAYISFNTLPGWNAIKSVRDAMLFHARQAKTPKEKADKARAFLAFLTEHADNKDSPYRLAIAKEAQIIANSDDAFLLHDYMEETNTAFYLSDVVDHAAHHGLRYLGDAALSSMPIGTLSAPIEEARKRIGDATNIVRLEQYLDFLNNRRFRMTLLCHADVPVRHKLNAKTLSHMWFSSDCHPKAARSRQAFGQIKGLDLTHANGTAAGTVGGRPLCACLLEIIAAGSHGIAWEPLLANATAMLRNVPRATVEKAFVSACPDLITKNLIDVSAESPGWATSLSTHPVAFSPATLAATHGDMVPNLRHQAIRLSPQQRLFLGLLDGHHDITQLQAACPELGNVEANLRAFADAALLSR
ncbi:MAG: class I SAM-dependent methyltransferase [Rhodospirillaceae bacterium]|nr:class I SAM-dependent methyltransferase [Rhodospirillaceae bacterium]